VRSLGSLSEILRSAASARLVGCAIIASVIRPWGRSRPDDSPYLRQEGLLLLSTGQLTDLLNRTIDAQPFLGELAADPPARGLFSALLLFGKGMTHDHSKLTPYQGQLKAFHTAMAATLGGGDRPLSWQRLLSGKVAVLGGQYSFVLARPTIDSSSLQPSGKATEAMRAAWD
jgi:hypothetical protein